MACALPLTLLLGWAKWGFGGVILGGALWFLPYLLEVHRHPRVPHSSCYGTGRVQGRILRLGARPGPRLRRPWPGDPGGCPDIRL